MRMEATLNQKLSQHQIMAPRMIQSMEILQMAIMVLRDRIDQELLDNPVLEVLEPEVEDGEFDNTVRSDEGDPARGELVIEEGSNHELDFDRLEASSRDWCNEFHDESRSSWNSAEDESERKYDAAQNMGNRPQSLQEYLSDQVAFLDLTKHEVTLVRHIISHIDGNGFLTVLDETDPQYRSMLLDRDYLPTRSLRRRSLSLSELAATLDDSTTLPEMEAALHHVQKLDPPGVGARDLMECLTLQVTAETPHADLVRGLILNHLEDISHNRLPAIERETGADRSTIKEAIAVIKHLNPKPGAGFVTEAIPYVVPDILVELDEHGVYTVKLLDDWLPKVYISQRYIELFKNRGSEPSVREYLKRKIQSAKWLQESIQQRRTTLEKVARAIIDYQRAFLDHGVEHLHPLKMQQIADQIGVHLTTVCRAVDDKWIQSPSGIFPLRRFFVGGKKVGDEDVAWEVMHQKLIEIIDHEDRSTPLTDEDLVRKMKEAGCPVMRRTITKYRQLAHIPASRARKDWTEAIS